LLGGNYWRIPVTLPGQEGERLLVTRRSATGSACGPVRRACGATLTLRLGGFGDLGASSIQLWAALTPDGVDPGALHASARLAAAGDPPAALARRATARPGLRTHDRRASTHGGWLLDAIIDE